MSRRISDNFSKEPNTDDTNAGKTKRQKEHGKKSSRPGNMRLRIAVTIYAAALIAYAIWSLLDAFVIPHGIVSLESIAQQTQSEEQDHGGGSDNNTDTESDDSDTNSGSDDYDSKESSDSGGDDSNDSSGSDGDDSDSGSGSNDDDSDSGSGSNDDDSDSGSGSNGAVITDTSYKDDGISITISTTRLLDTNIYVADVILEDASYLKTALAGNAFGRNLTETTSSIAQQHDAILAINGDYYGFRTSGYVMRGGYLYRTVRSDDSSQEDLVFYSDGTMEIVRESDVTAQQLAEDGATDIFSFGPGLVQDGEITVTAGEEVDRAQVNNPRCAIGMLSPLHYVFVVSDGRTSESEGLSLLELAQVMQDLGCTTAYNLDGGGSATMWFNGTVINKPTTFGESIEERAVSDIIYIGK